MRIGWFALSSRSFSLFSRNNAATVTAIMSAVPTPYDRQFDFESFQQNSPTSPLPGLQVDAELNHVKTSLDETQSRLAEIQRDDGNLGNEVVTIESLGQAVQAYLTYTGSVIRGAWLTATAYALKDVVTQGGSTYIAAVAHTSGTFATDLAAVKWVVMAPFTMGTALFADATARAAATPNFASQIGIQTDTKGIYISTGTSAGNWSDFTLAAGNVPNSLITAAMLTGTATAQLAIKDKITNQGADIVATSTLNLDAATGDIVDVTGTTSVTAITLAQGKERTIRFTGSLTFTNGASLVLPGAADIQTAAGDTAIVRGYAAGVVRVIDYSRANGYANVLQPNLGSLKVLYSSASVITVNLRGQSQQSIDITTNGVNGLDTGVKANSTPYHLHQIYNGSIIRYVLSLSATSPTLPAGYSALNYVGAQYIDGSGNLFPIYQWDNRAFVAPINLFNNQAGVTSYGAKTLPAQVPTTAVRCQGNRGASSSSAVYMTFMVAADASGTGRSATQASALSAVLDNYYFVADFDVPLITAQTIYVKMDTTSSFYRLDVTGWTYNF